MKVELVWITPDAENLIVKMARVSNPASAEAGKNNDRLIGYLIQHRHWSPFEMANACFRIETTRDIARQILRHRSFSFQEFSQRYAEVDFPKVPEYRTARAQDPKNRQNSIHGGLPATVEEMWVAGQRAVYLDALSNYQWAIQNGIAKEVARAVLPEGLTPSALYMNGTIRSWMHYLQNRCHPSTQEEHQDIAWEIYRQLRPHIPTILLNLPVGY